MHRESTRVGSLLHVRDPVGILQTKCFSRRPASQTQRGGEFSIFAVDDEPAGGRYGSDELMKLPTDRGNVRVDVRVIVFQIVQNRRAWPVVHEFGTLIEKCRVVFI